MSIDYAGTKPGLPPPLPEEPEHIHMRCKRYPTCDSMLAIEITPPGMPGGAHLYQCVRCKTTCGIATGGAVGF